MRPALKIVSDVMAYRLRKLEMANLAAAALMGLVLCLPAAEFTLRMAAAALLNLLVYLNNDYLDVEADLQAAGRDRERVRFLAEHRSAARTAQWGLALSLVALGAMKGPGLLLILAAGAGVCVAYSARLKRVAGADVLAMALWGTAMPMIGAPIDSRLGWTMAVQLGLISAVFETLQVLRDLDEDRGFGIQTTAVRLGARRTRWLARGLMMLAALYGAFFLHPLLGVGFAMGVLLLGPRSDVSRSWTRVKLLYGTLWLLVSGWLLVDGRSAGLIGGVARDELLPALSMLAGGW